MEYNSKEGSRLALFSRNKVLLERNLVICCSRLVCCPKLSKFKQCNFCNSCRSAYFEEMKLLLELIGDTEWF